MKLEIYLSEGVDYEDHTDTGSPLMVELKKSPFIHVSIHLYVGQLKMSRNLKVVQLSNGSIKLRLRRDGGGWHKSVRCVQ